MSKKHKRIFNLIAPIYAKFFNSQVKYYEETIDKVRSQEDIKSYKTVLDIGCGTGALCYVLYKKGLRVTGIDVAEKMVERSRAKLRGTGVKIKLVDPKKKFPFPDKSFDLVISSYVAHGLQPEERKKLYKEASRLAKSKVIFHDFNKKRSLGISIVEWLEGGDYFNFIKQAEGEIRANFKDVKILNVHKQAAWYTGVPKS